MKRYLFSKTWLLDNHSLMRISFFCVLIVLSIFMRYTYMVGSFVGGDELYYIRRLMEVLEGSLDTSTFRWYDYRVMIYLPQAPFNLVFGFNPFTMVFWPFVTAVLHVAVVYKISTLIYDDLRTSIFVSLIFSIAPLNVVEIRFMPDAIFSFFLSLTFLCLLASSKASTKKLRFVFFTSSWVSLILSFFVRENAFLIIPLLFIFTVLDKENRSFYFKTSGIFIITLVFIFSLLAAADILNIYARVISVWEFFTQDHIFRGLKQIPYFPYLHYIQHPMVNGYGISIMVFAGIAYFFYLKDKPSLLPVLWFLSIYLYFEFISPFHALRPAEGSFRYLMPFIAPSSLLAGRFFDRWINRLPPQTSLIEFLMPAVFILISFYLQSRELIYTVTLIPFIFYFSLLFSGYCKSKISLQDERSTKTNFGLLQYCAPLFLTVSIISSFSYITVAKYGYDRIALNELAKSLYGILKPMEPGLIAGNEHLLERKLNLFINDELHNRNAFENHDYRYLITIDQNLLRTAYQTKYNVPEYNKALHSKAESEEYNLLKKTRHYHIYVRKEAVN